MRSRITITFVTAVAVLLAACGSSSKTAGGAASTGTVGSAAGAATVKTASVSGEGTVLVDAQGCEIGTIAGPAEWDSDDAVKLIAAAATPPGS